MLACQVVEFLESIGCCQRCILIYLGERSESLYESQIHLDKVIGEAAEALEKSLEELPSHTSEEQTPDEVRKSQCPALSSVKKSCQLLTPDEGTVDTEDGVCMSASNGQIAHISKKQKYAVCIACIGLLQSGSTSNVITQISEAMLSGDHDANAFTLALALPVCLSLRVHRIWTLLKQAYPQIPEKGRTDHIATMKDVWKNLVGPPLGKMVDKTFIQGQYIEFIMNISASYAGDMDDCKIMDQLCESTFALRRKQHKKYAAGVYSKQSIDAAIKKLTDEEFLKVCPNPPGIPTEAVTYTDLKWQRDSIYMAGRYNKYSRELPQTPWFVEGERKMGSSVQELLCEILNKSVKAEDYRFSSSGREDVDVRCLGNGRPFVIEFINPCKTKFSRKEMTEFQAEVNLSSEMIHLRDLQIVDKKDVKNLKEGEEEKTKAYCALCIARAGYDPSLLKQLSGMKELVIQQKTPVRVLHRRPLLTRPRIIHEMWASSIDSFFFKLHLTTQAGTYIKEFVHGDLGRTTPNIRSILGLDVDIIALDVELSESPSTCWSALPYNFWPRFQMGG
ncbi:tRNA pseudouridine synthase Pus10-like isoform X1 [Macrobrachium nipponense]|uniref:tRNA pseudouridine synthase Pus10-like isoform X1 n=1 Tax=Macrobrachium nipponense TaxID=159736 RepID=UPI0030C813DB